MNLLTETEEAISESGHTHEDIVFIGSESGIYSCTWAEFIKLADFEYDNGFGAQKVASDLVIRFRDGSVMYRSEYDGSEDWNVIGNKNKSLKPRKQIKRLFASDEEVGWMTLSDINDHKSE